MNSTVSTLPIYTCSDFAYEASHNGPSRVSELYRRTSKTSHHRLILVDNPIWEIVMSKAQEAESRQDVVEAERYYQTALKLAEKFSVHDPRLSSILELSAQFYCRLGDYALAKTYYFAQAKLIRMSHGRLAPESGHALARLGFAYYNLGEFMAAAMCFRRALLVHLKNSGRMSLPTIRASQNLALVLQAQGKYEVAYKFSFYARSIALELLGVEHPIVAALDSQIEALQAQLHRN